MIALIPRWAWIVVAVLLGLAGFQYFRSRGQDKKADADTAKSVVVDAQHKAQTKASARVDTVVDTLRIREDHYIKVASALKARSDTVGQFATTLRDTAQMYRLRWQLVGMALDSTTAALSTSRQRADSLFADRNRWHVVADSAKTTMDALRKDLKAARAGCKIIPFVDCPSRIVMLGVGFGAGLLVAHNNIKLLSFHK
jgi:hypothetical protein